RPRGTGRRTAPARWRCGAPRRWPAPPSAGTTHRPPSPGPWPRPPGPPASADGTGRAWSADQLGEHDHVGAVAVGHRVEAAPAGDQAQPRGQGGVVDVVGREPRLGVPLPPLDGEPGPGAVGPDDLEPVAGTQVAQP